MKPLFSLALGLLVGALGSTLIGACGCPATADMPPGTYKLTSSEVGSPIEDAYTLVVGADAHLTEEYTRNGKRYVVRYVGTR